ncbi:MAG: MG2 domain-containing protein [Ignavibacteriota bacterium]
MRRNSLARTLLLLAVAAAGLGQSENEPYFSLRSSRTFESNGAPSVSLSASNVDSLDFRVYRIDDPVQFFLQLEDAHEFGGHVARPPHQPSFLQMIHDWKTGLRAGIRHSVRQQFTESPTAHFHDMLKGKRNAASQAHYPTSPVLNPQQLVLSFTHTVQSHERWGNENVDVDLKQRGVYLVEAVNKDLRAYTILMVSDLVTTTKTGRDGVAVFVADRNTGEPVRGAEITALTRNEKLGFSETDASGIAFLKIESGRSEDVRIVTRKDTDTTAAALYARPDLGSNWQGYIYTDRPVYRPGHTMHFRGILRVRTPTGYDVPASKSLSVEIQDPEQKPVYRRDLTTNANGTLHDEFTIPAGSALGSYSIEIHTGGESNLSGSFDVEEYKKPEYEVRVTPAKFRILQGDTAQATIEARYYFGEPVSGAKVKYSVYRSRYWFPLFYDPEDDGNSFGDNQPDADDTGGDQLSDQEGKLDQDGRLTITFPTAMSDKKYDYRYRVEAHVTDDAGRDILGHGGLLATYGSFVLNVSPDKYFYAPGNTAELTIQARDYDNNAVQTHAHVELLPWDWRDRALGESKGSADVDTGSDGIGKARLTIPAAGTYRVRVTAKTPENRTVEDYAAIWTAGAGFDFYGDSAQKTLQIVLDKKSYHPGETAQVLIMAGKPNTPVYVSIEGRELSSYRLIRSQDSTAVFEVPLAATNEPGLYVSAQFVRGGNVYRGTKYIKVPPVDHQMNVAIATDKPQYQPGQSAQYSITATALDGKPVPQAEFSLGVVDETIYAIRPDMMQNPLAYFFSHEWNRVESMDSLDYYFAGEAGKRRMQLARLRPPSRLAQLKPEHLVQPKVRKAFPDTAFWAADVTTDSTGHAKAKVDFPDSLTTWRATARGVTRDTKLGAATLKTIVRKNLIIRLAVPRFFVQGDEVTVSALVHNYLANPKKVRVSLDLKGLDAIDGATKDIEVLSRSEVKVDWRVRAQQVRSATLTGKALTDEESDAMELELPVNVPGVRLAVPHGGTLTAGGSAAYDFTFPNRVSPGSRSLAIQLSPSVAGSLFGALEYLTTFPYGCVEQTMSSFLPNIIVTAAVKDLGLKTNLDPAATQTKIRAGLDRLYSFQHEDGGWGWWQTDESHPFMTAYVVAGLAQAQSAGVEIKPDAMARGAAWVSAQFVKDPKLAADLRAYMQYSLVLAGRTDSNGLGDVYAQRSKLSPYGLAILGLAMESAKDGRASEIAGALEQSAKQDEQQAWWPATRDEMLDFSADVTPEATAFVTKFLSHQRAASPLLPKAALWLMNHRDEGYWWESTKETAMVIYGLTDYLKVSNELKPNFTATVFVNDKPAVTRKFDQATGLASPDIVLDESQLAAGVNHVRVTTQGAGRLYYSTRAEYYSTEDKLQKTGSVSLNILRDYFKLAPQKDGDKIVYDLAPLNGPVAQGDIVAVRLTVTGSEWRYLLAEDPIPAGTEFIERDDSYELKSRPPWWQYYFTRRELHDDRMAIFERYFPLGQQTYFYLLKVVNPGIFQVSPARVQPMYQPSFMATTESRRLEVK